MQLVLLVIHMMIAAALVGVVLLQKSEGGALGIGGGGLNDTWAWDGTRWDSLDLAPAYLRPPGRTWHDLAWDAERRALVVFGGWIGHGVELGDTWERGTAR